MEQTNKQKWTQWMVVALILALIAGVWIWKATAKPSASAVTPNTTGSASESETPQTEDQTYPYLRTSFDVEALKAEKKAIVVMFMGQGCSACEEMDPILKQMYESYYGKVIITKVDVWEHPEALGDFPVQFIPTLFFYNADGTPYQASAAQGKELTYSKDSKGTVTYTSYTGVLSESSLEEIIKDMISQ